MISPDGIDTRFCPPAASPLAELIVERNYHCGVEIGVWLGGSSKLLLDLPMIEHLYMVDPWNSAYQYGTNYDQGQFDTFYQSVCELLNHYDSRKTILRMTSEEASKVLPKNLDFVYIDGDHTTEGVTADIGFYRNSINPKGILCGDDFNFSSVANAVLAMFGAKIKMKDYGFIAKQDGRLIPARVPNRFWYVEEADL